jgi:AcrR family transcriptional regulator
MQDIATACGISKSLLYHHFDSKDAIYTQVASLTSQNLYSFVEGRVSAERTPSRRIRAFMLASADFFHSHRWAWIASTNAFWSDASQRRQKERLMRRDRYEHFLRSLIQEAIDAGEIRRDIDVAMTGRLILSSLNWMHRWYDPSKPSTPAELADTYFDLVFKGLRADA